MVTSQALAVIVIQPLLSQHKRLDPTRRQAPRGSSPVQKANHLGCLLPRPQLTGMWEVGEQDVLGKGAPGTLWLCGCLFPLLPFPQVLLTSHSV